MTTLSPIVFDRSLIAARRRRALTRDEAAADFLLQPIADDIDLRLATISRRFPIAIDLGGGGRVAARIAASGKADRVFRADVLAAEGDRPDLVVDEEALPFAAESVDLMVASLTLQAVNDLPGVLAQVRRALRPDGLFLATIAGGETLHELRECLIAAEIEVTGGASPRVAPFADLRTLAGLLQRAGFALPVADVDRLTIRYSTMFALMADLRALGATNTLVDRLRTPLNRQVLLRAAALYGERFADSDGRIRATLDIVSLSGWAPHESQQKPLKPGSAQARLADALGTAELTSGETAKPSGPRD